VDTTAQEQLEVDVVPHNATIVKNGVICLENAPTILDQEILVLTTMEVPEAGVGVALVGPTKVCLCTWLIHPTLPQVGQVHRTTLLLKMSVISHNRATPNPILKKCQQICSRLSQQMGAIGQFNLMEQVFQSLARAMGHILV